MFRLAVDAPPRRWSAFMFFILSPRPSGHGERTNKHGLDEVAPEKVGPLDADRLRLEGAVEVDPERELHRVEVLGEKRAPVGPVPDGLEVG